MADPGFGGRGGGGVNCHKQGRSPCSRHEVASGGWVREGGVTPPDVEENGNQEMLRGLLKHTKIRMLYGYIVYVAVEVLGVSTRVGHRTCTRASLHVRHTRSLRGR